MSTPVDTACVALRSFVHLSGALRAQALVPQDAGPPALVSCVRLGPLEVEIGERSVTLPHDVELEATAPDLGMLRPLPPFEISAERGEVAGMIGGLELVGDAVMTIAEAVGPQAAIVVEMESTNPDLPLVVSARAGEPVLVTLGDDEYEL
ncbi:MAG: hypothetical protein ACJ762_03085 [Solirubrobacteraceae bacterium]